MYPPIGLMETNVEVALSATFPVTEPGNEHSTKYTFEMFVRLRGIETTVVGSWVYMGA
jgi:hypothetical protein